MIYNRIYNDYSNYSYSPQYYNYSAPYYYDYSNYGSPYDCTYYGSPYNYAYAPQVTYVYVPQYGQVYYDPYSAYTTYSRYGYPYSAYTTYSSYGYPYSTYYPSYASYGDDYGYGYNDYGYDNYGYSDYGYRNDSLYGGLLNNLPVGDLIQQLGGNSFIGELLSGFLTQGYDQGYLAGQFARDNGYKDDYYYDPYMVNDTSYDLYSSNLGENRRIFSEGYEAGYRDALNTRQDDYYPYEDRQPDLISLLIGNTLSGFTGG